MTLVELMLAVSIGSVVTLVAMSLFVFGARMSRIPAVHGILDVQARAPVEHIKNGVRRGERLTLQDGDDKLVVTDGSGHEVWYYYLDKDSNPATLRDNCLMYDPRIPGSPPETLLTGLDRSSGLPLFNTPMGMTVSHVGVNLRLAGQASSGVSEIQAVDVQTTVALRNW